MLRQFPAFANVPDEQLQWLLDRADEQTYPADTAIAKPGDAIDHMLLVLDGQITIDSGQNSAADDIAVYGPHSLLGVMPFSRMKTMNNRICTESPVHLLRLHRNQFRDMVHECYELTEACVQQMTDRVRDFTRFVQQEDKMASLGKLSAGLAHELNNPVSAVVRSADALKAQMRATPERFKAVMAIQLPQAEVDAVNTFLFAKIDQPLAPLGLMERTTREDDLTDWLDDHDIPNPDDLIIPLVEFGFVAADLDRLAEQIKAHNLPAVLGWVVSNLITEKLVLDIADASTRIASLVNAIKSYTYMDRGAGKDTLNLGEGIRSTVTLLTYKLKAKHIAVSMDIPPDLPTLCGWPGELNQVWTNLIDNAVDAMPDGGKLQIRAEKDERPDGSAFVLTRVIDNGAGIPEASQKKIFDPFYTTKEIGKGTGLGLDIVNGIIRHHNGSIKVNSKPGETEFIICLPV